MQIFNIGFCGKSAEEFFTLLTKNGVKKLIDIRLNRVSQLAGFANAKHLPYLLKIHGIEYEYMSEFAPTKEILSGYRSGEMKWSEYEKRFKILLARRVKKEDIDIVKFQNAVFLCSEPTDQECHRRLVCEHIKSFYPEVEICPL
ncbi:DUF488 domain-containing protein [Campylobacter sp.]|uniref:DUF488 domain-containing protein n=1 Tax=Campylobacter sp. TaxID=205 RepID=UPI0027007681|nr:DUF488 domain-containing protein [Campylobacter sp.]